MGASDPFPVGYVIWFGSLDFVATGDGHGTDILPYGANPDTPTPPSWRGRRPRRHAWRVRMAGRRAARLATPTWVEDGASQPAAAAEDVAASPPPSAASVLPNEGATVPSPFPFGMRNTAITCASSVSTDMSAYEDLPGHHLNSIRNLIT